MPNLDLAVPCARENGRKSCRMLFQQMDGLIVAIKGGQKWFGEHPLQLGRIQCPSIFHLVAKWVLGSVTSRDCAEIDVFFKQYNP